jgi:F-type H+-transporting ATPase subunit b
MRVLATRILSCRAVAAIAVLLLTAGQACAEESSGSKSVMDSGTIYNALWSLGIFVALLLILGKLAWKPALAALEAREKHIADALDTAARQQAQSQELLGQYQARLATADAEAARRLGEAVQAGEDAREKILDAAKREAAEIAQRAVGEIDTAKDVALRELYTFAADLATSAAARIIQKELNPTDQRRIVDESLEQIRQRASGAKVGRG